MKNWYTENMSNEKQPTPMMAQYLSIKSKYPDTILFFRLGDFYEMFDEQASKTAVETSSQAKAYTVSFPALTGTSEAKKLFEPRSR